MDLSRDGRTRLVLGAVATVAVFGSAVVAQHSVLAAVGGRLATGDLGGLLFVAWLTALLVVLVGRTAGSDGERTGERGAERSDEPR